jgi:polyhydroxybutyrate depolymerase
MLSSPAVDSRRIVRRLQIALVVVGVLFVTLPILCTMRRLRGGKDLEIAAATYHAAPRAVCEAGSRAGPPGWSDDERTAKGLGFNVRTPANYEATRAHPLIIVYAPRGSPPGLVERYVGLTRAATAAGFVIAYAGSQELSRATIVALAEIPRTIAKRWCIDESRVFLTGHSDGGTTAEALAFLPETRGIAAAVAPSGAGIRGADLAAETCPPPIPVMVLHAKSDWVFPGYGREAARWWAKCNGCDVEHPIARADGCRAFPGCESGVETLYCETEGGHLDWPAKNEALIEFFSAVR